MTNLQINLNQFMSKLQSFADLLNISVGEVEQLKEMDTPEGHRFYTAYLNFQRGIHPTSEFINTYKSI